MTKTSAVKICLSLFICTLLSGCLVFPLKQTDPDRNLNWCAPLLNCASTEAVTPVHMIKPFVVTMEFDQAWPMIVDSVSMLKGTSIEVEYDGYLFAKSHSPTMKFVDYFEVLWSPAEGNKADRLNVRSSSLLGIWDLGINKARTQTLREDLISKGVIGK